MNLIDPPTWEEKRFYLLREDYSEYSIELHNFILRHVDNFDELDEPSLSDEDYMNLVDKVFPDMQDQFADRFSNIIYEISDQTGKNSSIPEIRTYLLSAYRRLLEIRSYTTFELNDLYRAVRKEKKQFNSQWNDRHGRIQDASTFLNESDLDDLDRYLRMAMWNKHEAIVLSLGKDPREVTLDKIQTLPDRNSSCPSPFRLDYENRLDLLTRATCVALIEPIEPSKFIGWCLDKSIDLPPDLVRGREGYSLKEFKRLREENEKLKAEHLNQGFDAERDWEGPLKFEGQKPVSERTVSVIMLGTAMAAYGFHFGERCENAVTDMIRDFISLSGHLPKSSSEKIRERGLKLHRGSIIAALEAARSKLGVDWLEADSENFGLKYPFRKDRFRIPKDDKKK